MLFPILVSWISSFHSSPSTHCRRNQRLQVKERCIQFEVSGAVGDSSATLFTVYTEHFLYTFQLKGVIATGRGGTAVSAGLVVQTMDEPPQQGLILFALVRSEGSKQGLKNIGLGIVQRPPCKTVHTI